MELVPSESSAAPEGVSEREEESPSFSVVSVCDWRQMDRQTEKGRARCAYVEATHDLQRVCLCFILYSHSGKERVRGVNSLGMWVSHVYGQLCARR